MIKQSLEEILKEIAEEIYPFLHSPTPDDPYLIEQRGANLQSYIARLTKMISDCKFWKDIAIHQAILDSRGQVAQTVMNKFCEAKCQHENYAVNVIDGLIKKCYAENDWNRTLLSKAKAEYIASQQSRQNPH